MCFLPPSFVKTVKGIQCWVKFTNNWLIICNYYITLWLIDELVIDRYPLTCLHCSIRSLEVERMANNCFRAYHLTHFNGMCIIQFTKITPCICSHQWWWQVQGVNSCRALPDLMKERSRNLRYNTVQYIFCWYIEPNVLLKRWWWWFLTAFNLYDGIANINYASETPICRDSFISSPMSSVNGSPTPGMGVIAPLAECHQPCW